jgi:hypothetical protein
MMKKFALLAAAILMSGFFGKAATAQEKAKGEKANVPTVKVLVENDRVKVYEGRFKPGDKSARMANHPARGEFAITDGQMRHYYSDGKT